MGDRLKLQDCKCPICMSILIEPVRMPCNHELCMPCFKKNVEEAHFTCPICRQRISSWARKHARSNQLVDLKRWKQIQETFPLLCQRRLDGEDDGSDCDAESPVRRNILVAQPGEIRKEYEQEISKFHRIREEEEKEASEQSEQLIKRLQREEIKRYEERRKCEEAQRRKDEELAKSIAAQLDQDDDWKKSQEEQASRDEEIARRLQEQEQSPPPSTVVSLLSPSTSSAHRGASSSMKCNRLEHLFKMQECRRVLSTSRESSSLETSQETQSSPPAHAFAAFSSSSRENSSQESQTSRADAPDTFSVPQASTSRLPSMDTMDDVVVAHRTRSAESEDSITGEVCHFKPINTSPRTAQRKLADGSCDSPPIIHSTPKNLNKLQEKKRNKFMPSGSSKLVERLSKKLEVPPSSSSEMKSQGKVSREVQVSPEKPSKRVKVKGVCEFDREDTSKATTSFRRTHVDHQKGDKRRNELQKKLSRFSRKMKKEVESNHSSGSPKDKNAESGPTKSDLRENSIRSSSAGLPVVRKEGKAVLKDQNENYFKEDTENDAPRDRHRSNSAETRLARSDSTDAKGDNNKTVNLSGFHSNGFHGKSSSKGPSHLPMDEKGKRRHRTEPRMSHGAKTMEKYMKLLSAEQRKLRQEELDRKIALELQREFEEEKPETARVVRTKGSEDAYPLRVGRKRTYREVSPEAE